MRTDVPHDPTVWYRRTTRLRWWWRRGGWRHLALAPLAVACLLPLFWMVATSLREPGQPLPSTPEWIPDPISWDNYPAVFDLVDLWRYAANSAFVVGLAVPLTVVVASWAGFALALLPATWRLRVTVYSFVVLMVPLAAVWIPRFVLFNEAGLTDTPWALIAPALMGTSPFYVMLCMWGFLRVPAEVYEAARLDGAGVVRMWAGIGLPLARGSIAAVAMLAFVVYWSNYLDPLLFIRTPERQTLPFVLQMLFQLARSDWPLLMAGATMVTGPVVVVFLLGQRYLLEEVRMIGGSSGK